MSARKTRSLVAASRRSGARSRAPKRDQPEDGQHEEKQFEQSRAPVGREAENSLDEVHTYLLCFPRSPTRSSYSLPPTSRPPLQCST